MAIRREYTRASLDEAEVDPDPIRQFRAWFDPVLAAGLPDPTAMTLATATPDGRPSARVVLLSSFDDRGFVFHSNYESRKGAELASNSRAALAFYWPSFERQVRIEGRVDRTAPAESDAYFAGRPEGARIGAIASRQSMVVDSRDVLEARVREVERRHPDGQPPRPAHWGGYRLEPDHFEFWQGRPSRLHDRLRYRMLEPGGWALERLSP